VNERFIRASVFDEHFTIRDRDKHPGEEF
jgi:hypothetical protein